MDVDQAIRIVRESKILHEDVIREAGQYLAAEVERLREENNRLKDFTLELRSVIESGKKTLREVNGPGKFKVRGDNYFHS